MGAGVPPPRGRAAAHAPYFVALAGVLALLLLLCCYFCYFCCTKISELSECEALAPTTTTARPKIQPVVREGATAMARLCQQLPPAKGDQVFPAPAPAPVPATPAPAPLAAPCDPAPAPAAPAGCQEAATR